MTMPSVPRPFLLCAAAAAVCSACVVPVGPAWVDPEGNYPPILRSASPPVGSVLTRASDGAEAMQVRVVLADQNTKDKLSIRFIIDYPPYDEAVSRLAWSFALPGSDQIERPPVYFAPSCAEHGIAAGPRDHRLLLAVSDRDFVPYEPGKTALDEVLSKDNFLLEAVWPFQMECP
jgi:hypothetical protein